ncbi:MAG: NAD(P)(+) transhydrogenase (Re/Si-specific) subunit beta [candidate division Zixibacteria bacterium]|nr:NAD(P)(+) transhydrogenase (Re/Si-specific) subunit beta [candidate division Zixibacteria bacterium]MBU1469518.1 NAD(P)(+) transhydrogenase (Re/Si-specific) subunit beta [candidate division Zixibacteria bacterium]MBU2624758.1 NAD(P)(+) transhydrogenase (Re/Si-specific) subunit beta [candidate division Zixibacteria bacterium]
MLNQNIVNLVYLLAAVLMIVGLKGLAHPRSAVRGNRMAAVGMLAAIAATLLSGKLEWHYIVLGIIIGSIIGAIAAIKVKMTAMPEMVGLFNGFGGGASVLVAGSALVAAMHYAAGQDASTQMKVATAASGIIGSVTFFGSYVAFGKLAEFLAVKWKLHAWQKLVKYGFSLVVIGGTVWFGVISIDIAGLPLSAGVMLSGILIGGLLLNKKDRFPGMNALKWLVAVASLVFGILAVLNPENLMFFWVMVGVAGVLGVLLTISIGGADMPVVIALLNSYSGLAAAATGFVIDNNVLIIAGSLVGASGIILTNIMCKAMNRSLANVLFGVMGPTSETPDADDVYGGKIKATSAEEIAMLFDGARRVAIVPGYGMAVAQAQHTVRDLADLLEKKGIQVDYAIHPVAGRMPGHMNVLLAEADVDYDKLKEMDEINPTMAQVDVAIVIGANDVVNPVARTDPKSPIAGMPIIDVDKARTVVVIKRSLSPGFAGIPNPLFANDNTLMFFNDGKKAILEIIAAVKES